MSDAVSSALHGSGRVLLVEGEAGIGKTSLLRCLSRHAERRGMQVHEARGGPLERKFPFGVVRQLFETTLVRRTPQQRRKLLAGAASGAALVVGVDASHAGDIDLLRALHGLYWLCANLAEERPLLAIVDDAHWVDAESLSWLGYMANRADDLALLVAVGARVGEEVADPASLAAMRSVPAARVLRPAALGEEAAGELVRAIVGDGADGHFCRACHGATGGNPLFLRELALETRRQEIPPVAASADRVGTLGPEAISAATLVRLARLREPAVPIALAVAILGLDAEVRHAAALAGVDMELAERAADVLAAAGILERERPLNFVHPVVATAIHADLPRGAASQAHARAADVLAADGVDAGVVASHLVLVDPASDAQVRERLERAAYEALARGAPSAAARFLRRAVQETADPNERAALTVQLGRAELIGGNASAVEHLTEGYVRLEDDRLLLESALLLCRALMFAGRFDEVEPFVRTTVERAGRPEDDPLVARLYAELLMTTAFRASSAADVARRLPRLLAAAPRAGPAGRLMFIVGGMHAAISLERCCETRRLVERGLAQGRLIAEETADSLASGMAACALAFVDALDEVETYLEQLAADALARSSVLAYVSALPWRGWVALRRGDVPAAIADLRAALELAEQHRLDFPLPFVRAFLADALLEDGRIGEAESLAEATVIEELSVDSVKAIAANARGRVRLASGRREEGIADLVRAGEYQEMIGHLNPNATHWRSTLAMALGRGSSEALELAETELAYARRADCPRAIGVALRAAGRLRGGEDGLRLLREATDTLDRSPARLEHARSLVWEGAELRRQGRRAQAREPLRRALDVADRLGATRLAGEASTELEAAGGRPRRRRLTGAAAFDADRAAGGRPGRVGPAQPGDRAGAVREPQDRRDASRRRLSQARHPLPRRPAGGAGVLIAVTPAPGSRGRGS